MKLAIPSYVWDQARTLKRRVMKAAALKDSAKAAAQTAAKAVKVAASAAAKAASTSAKAYS
jgi:hypothetical protein